MGTARRGPIAKPPTVQVGELTIRLLDGGHLWLDGGAMFGIIPKPMWSKLTEADEVNRIPLATTCCLVESGGKRVLVETGIGPKAKFADKEQAFFRLVDSWLLDSLEAVGIDRESIDYVIPTHLHFDHAGGGTMPDGGGGYKPTFPNAKYVVQRGEWEDATSGHAVMTATYRKENLAPLEAASLLSFVDGAAEIVPGVSVRRMSGHTRHSQGVIFSSGDEKAIQPGDLMPTGAHAGLPYNMAYDLLPMDNMKNKSEMLEDGLEGGWRLLLGQDPTDAVWAIKVDDRGRYRLVPQR